MPTELGLPKYHKYSEKKAGEKLVDMGEFIGSTEGKFGAQHNFIEMKTGQQVVLNKAGGLDWQIEKGRIAEGGVYDVIYDGKDVLTKGTFAGKEAHKFKILRYDDAELQAAGVKRAGGTVATAAAVVPRPLEDAPATAQALDDLD